MLNRIIHAQNKAKDEVKSYILILWLEIGVFIMIVLHIHLHILSHHFVSLCWILVGFLFLPLY